MTKATLNNRASDKFMADLHFGAQALFAKQMREGPTDDPEQISVYAHKAIDEMVRSAGLRREPSQDSPKKEGYIFYECYSTSEGQLVYLVNGFARIYKDGEEFVGLDFSNSPPF